MKKRFVKEIACVVILSLIFFPSLAFAQPPAQGPAEQGPAGKEGEEIPISNIAQKLGLSLEQKEQLKEQRFQQKYNKMETRNKIRLKELELRHELEKEVINQETIDKIVVELKELQGITIEQRVASILKMKEILTLEQFEKLQSLDKLRMHRGKQGAHQGQDLKNRTHEFSNQ